MRERDARIVTSPMVGVLTWENANLLMKLIGFDENISQLQDGISGQNQRELGCRRPNFKSLVGIRYRELNLGHQHTRWNSLRFDQKSRNIFIKTNQVSSTNWHSLMRNV